MMRISLVTETPRLEVTVNWTRYSPVFSVSFTVVPAELGLPKVMLRGALPPMYYH